MARLALLGSKKKVQSYFNVRARHAHQHYSLFFFNFYFVLFQVPRQCHDGGEDGEGSSFTAEDAGAEANGNGAAFGSAGSFLGGKTALTAGHHGDPFCTVSRFFVENFPQRNTAALVKEEHEVIVLEAVAHGVKIR